ncbi:MAG: SH3 domain-containing protein [Lachnospiraceae bacterium]|nr:SH3 domain-containing protein [Lachnospiraceae bacterium]
MRLYAHMMLGGCIWTLLYIVFNRILPHELPLKWRRLLLRINIAFYLLPVPWMAAEVKELVRWLLERAGMTFPQNKMDNIFDAASAWNCFIVLNEDGRIVQITGYQKLLPVLLAAFAVCGALLVGWVALYIGISNQYRKNMVFLEADRYVKDKCAGRKIMVGVSPCILSPVTVGIVKPVILFPVDYHKYENSMEEILLHEVNHVLCADIVERFFCFAAVVIHFFNPLVYYLLRENIVVSEMLSDEAAVKGRTKKQKADYIRCIMEASQKTNHREMMILSLGKSKSLLRKRMEQIMNTNKKKIWKKKTAIVIAAVCALAGSIPALAYQKPREYVQSGDNWDDRDILVFSQTGAQNPMEGRHIDFSHGETVFVSEEGNADYSANDYSVRQQQSVCAHSYTSGTIAEHSGHTDGSCTVVTYQAQKCTKCGSAVRGDEIATFTYKSCPHTGMGTTEPDINMTDEIKSLTSKLGVVNSDALRLRSAADKGAAVHALLKEGEVVEIIAEDGDFYKVIIKSEDAEELLEGYVRKEYLDLFTESEHVRRSVLRPDNMILTDSSKKIQVCIAEQESVLAVFDAIESLPVQLGEKHYSGKADGYRYHLVFYLDQTLVSDIYIWDDVLVLNNEKYYFIQGEQLDGMLQELETEYE